MLICKKCGQKYEYLPEDAKFTCPYCGTTNNSGNTRPAATPYPENTKIEKEKIKQEETTSIADVIEEEVETIEEDVYSTADLSETASETDPCIEKAIATDEEDFDEEKSKRKKRAALGTIATCLSLLLLAISFVIFRISDSLLHSDRLTNITGILTIVFLVAFVISIFFIAGSSIEAEKISRL